MKNTITKMFAVAGMVAATAFVSNAQTSKGTILIGGNAGFNSVGETKSTSGSVSVTVPGYSTYSFAPEVGYFVMDNLAVGLMLDMNTSKVSLATSTDGKTNEWVKQSAMNYGLFAKHFMSINNNLYYHGMLGVGMMSSTYTERNPKPGSASDLQDGIKHTSSGMGLTITPGLTYFLNSNWGLDISFSNLIQYASMTETQELNSNKVETTSSTFGITAGLTPTLGLYYYMGK